MCEAKHQKNRKNTNLSTNNYEQRFSVLNISLISWFLYVNVLVLCFVFMYILHGIEYDYLEDGVVERRVLNSDYGRECQLRSGLVTDSVVTIQVDRYQLFDGYH